MAARPDEASPLRVVFVGNAGWSVPSLEALAASPHDVATVLTRSPRPAGRGQQPSPTPVATAARTLGVPVLETDTVRSGEGFEEIAAARPDVLVVVAYGEILPETVLSIPRLMPVNVHFSLLPALRGAAPVQRAILEGLHETGVTTMRMDAGMDTGPVLLQRSESIGDEDDSGSLGARLAAIGGELLVETLDALAAGTLDEQPQDDRAASVAPKLTPADERLDWTRPAAEIARRVRALAPSPGATTTVSGTRLKVFRARPGGDSWPDAGPGEVRLLGGAPVVATGLGALLLVEVQPEGRRRMGGSEWARGARLPDGARLGG